MLYLDHHATTPTDPRVAQLVYRYLTEDFGNASSTDHEYGDRAQAAVQQAAQQVAQLVGCSPREILWTSGATESINLAIQGSLPIPSSPHPLTSSPPPLTSPPPHLPKIALMPLEHKAVLDTCRALEQRGQAELIELRVDSRGRLDLEHLEQVCAQGLALLCVMAANNEIGNIYPLQAIGKIARRHGIPWLCDGSQAVGKIPIRFQDWGITYLAISAHKLYGPKGVGALVVRRGCSLAPLILGGGHQQGMRSGTLNVPGIVGLGAACRLRTQEMAADEARIAALRDRLQAQLAHSIPELIVNGDPDSRLAGNLHLSIPGIPNSAIIARLRHQLALSTGSACSSGVETPSHVLRAIGLPSPAIEGALRIGLGKFTTPAEIDQAAQLLTQAITETRQLLTLP